MHTGLVLHGTVRVQASPGTAQNSHDSPQATQAVFSTLDQTESLRNWVLPDAVTPVLLIKPIILTGNNGRLAVIADSRASTQLLRDHGMVSASPHPYVAQIHIALNL
ncbi:hypothetical protein E2C01_001767 [Portunus trituberculatus]|uniref:Uncharacterized protein n=1 Tax=Portunus trituberculatus TaxID=210409 RepID=A0A5B7CKB2_PORTR|nr:hypothetical protein [Portunus trituberculatus]